MKEIKIKKLIKIMSIIGIFVFIKNACAKDVLYEIAYRVRPSESMETGTPRADSKTNIQDQIEQNNSVKKSNSNKDNQEYFEDTYYDSIPKDNDLDLDSLLENNSALNHQQKYEGHFKIGNPYKIFGISYAPQNYESFEEEGTASWYGSEFHGRKTANGEIYNIDDITAAHPTLPLPSLIKITNLYNNKSATVRVNDRGPFAKNRIIDVSEKTSEILGFKNKGTTKVKVVFLRKETDEMLSKLGISDKSLKVNDDANDNALQDKELELIY
jgi:rare lipoprotein A (peptidoglycan hydrolase)